MSTTTTYTVCEQCRKVNRVEVASAESKQPVCGHCQSQLPVKNGVSELSAAGLKELIAKSPIPVVADFWASWCGPCRAFAPTFQSAAQRHSGEFVFVKIDTQANPQAGELYSIRGIPTVLMFNAGSEINRQSGAMPPPMFEQWLGAGNEA